MNLIDKDKLTKDFEEECMGDCCCCRHSIRGTGECGFIAEFPIEIEIVQCKDCIHKNGLNHCPHKNDIWVADDWFCADGVRKDK